MCTFCTDVGHGERWYMNFENYLYRKIFPEPEDLERAKQSHLKALADTDRYGDPAYNHDVEYLRQKYVSMPGQVITLEEANRVMDIAEEAARREDTLVVLARCNCALEFRGQMDYRCIVFGIPVSWSSELGYSRYPNEGLTEFGGAQWRELRRELTRGRKVPFTAADARELLQLWDKKGLHHTLVSRGVLPLIDGICNCEAPYCMRIRHRRMHSIQNVLLKGHTVARVDPTACNLCGACARHCGFGAIRVSPWSELVHIDPTLCYGCGLCRGVCKPNAISMVEREMVPAARDLW
jgi:ferredoxin